MTDDSAVDWPPSATGIHSFQLRILAGMRNSEALVERALQELGTDRAKLASAQSQTERVFAPTNRFENAIALLGRPLSSETVHAESASPGTGPLLTKLTDELPLWPDLVFYLLGEPNSPIAHDFGFARSPGSPAVTIRVPEDLRPWACLHGEVVEGFGPPVQEGDIWAPHEEYKFRIRDQDGTTGHFWATFSWNLLQHIEWA